MLEYIVILDFEATCWKDKKEHEIIEFPSIIWKWDEEKDTFTKIDAIQIFCKPIKTPILSDFCKELTGITQEQVDAGIPLPDALKLHHQWLLKYIPDLSKAIIGTCGHWDMRTMLPMDVELHGIKDLPSIYRRYLNVKECWTDITKITKKQGMPEMLGYFNLELEGRHHSGIDDCHNISRIFEQLINSGLTKQKVEELIHHV